MNQLREYLRYYFKAKTKFGVHSPFVYQFITEVMEDDRYFYVFETIDKQRKQLQKTHSGFRNLPSIYGELLFKIVHYYKPKTIVELGVGYGLNTLYLTAVLSDLQYIGWNNTAKFSKPSDLNTPDTVSTIELIQGKFDSQKITKSLKRLDFLVINGYHLQDNPFTYFTALLPACHNDTIIVVTGLRTSAAVWQSWQSLQKHTAVTTTIDLYHVGLVFLRQEHLAKEHFTIIDYALKPWKLGFG